MKKIISLFMLMVLMFTMCACESTVPTVIPTPEITVSPGTTASPNTTFFTETAEATNTVPNTNSMDDPFWSQIFLSKGVFNETIKEDAYIYSTFSVRPMKDTGLLWCPRAFLMMEYFVNNNKFDAPRYKESPTEAYEYTIKMYYHEANKETVCEEDFIGPYTLRPINVDTHLEHLTMFRLSVVDSPEGQFVDEFELDKTYNFLICVMKGDQVLSYGYCSHEWEALDNQYRELFNRYWATRDRSEGILSGMHPETEKDIQDQHELGFIETGPWMG